MAAGFYTMAIVHLVPRPPDDSIEYFVAAGSFFSRCKQTGL
jgi:hypothetical protein